MPRFHDADVTDIKCMLPVLAVFCNLFFFIMRFSLATCWLYINEVLCL